jgi:hypothetical protein
MNSVLGSMSPDTSCVVDYSWHHPGSEAYNQLLERSSEELSETASAIDRGSSALSAKNRLSADVYSGDQSVQKHKYMNYRQYVGRTAS